MPCITLQILSREHSYKFSWILTQTEVISIRSLRMRIISANISLVPIYVLPFRENIPYIVASFLLVRYHLLPVDSVYIFWCVHRASQKQEFRSQRDTDGYQTTRSGKIFRCGHWPTSSPRPYVSHEENETGKTYGRGDEVGHWRRYYNYALWNSFRF